MTKRETLMEILHTLAPYEHLVEQTQKVFNVLMEGACVQYEVILSDFIPSSKIKIIKAIRDYRDIGLREVKEMVERCLELPEVVLSTEEKDKALGLASALRSAGGVVTLSEKEYKDL